MSGELRPVPLRLGLIGLSEGNGHPYSWAAICNGYDRQAMESCGFSGIPRYLERRSFPADQLPDARVVSVWTQDPRLSRHIAAATLIPEVVERPEDMIGGIDAVLLARDDVATREALAAPFLKAGLSVFIDKPMAATVAQARRLFDLQARPGQIFTCSALRYLDCLRPSPDDLERLGRVDHVDAIVFNDWDRYAVHVIEPVLGWLPAPGRVVGKRPFAGRAARGLAVTWSEGVTATFVATGSPETPIRLRLFGPGGTVELGGSDNFTAFRSALAAFCAVVRGDDPPIPEDFVLSVIDLLEAGSAS